MPTPWDKSLPTGVRLRNVAILSGVGLLVLCCLCGIVSPRTPAPAPTPGATAAPTVALPPTATRAPAATVPPTATITPSPSATSRPADPPAAPTVTPTPKPTNAATPILPTATRPVPANTATAVAATPAPPPAASACPQGCTAQQTGCAIKGNISDSGEKIYHVPGGASYNATLIDPAKGERWFCTEAEAQANGWRKSQQ